MNKTIGKVVSIISNLVLVRIEGDVFQNEICFIYLGEEKLMAEVIKIIGDIAYVQVFESTRGLKPGSKVEFEGHMLEVELGPGLLSKNFDGLQNDLDKMEGVFLKRGLYTPALEDDKKWAFTPLAKVGDRVVAGDWLGNVKENWLDHKIMVPFKFEGEYTVASVAKEGQYTINDVVATLKDKEGEIHNVTMVQKWPVKLAVKAYKSKPRPFRLLETGVRVIDTMNPILEGGTGFIPGPFGTGKTVLQHSLAKYADADIIIMAACGERANEVVEIFAEFPHLEDPRTGRSLYERTTIIANTSNMPVAAREASVYTAMTIGEYYRAMGCIDGHFLPENLGHGQAAAGIDRKSTAIFHKEANGFQIPLRNGGIRGGEGAVIVHRQQHIRKHRLNLSKFWGFRCKSRRPQHRRCRDTHWENPPPPHHRWGRRRNLRPGAWAHRFPHRPRRPGSFCPVFSADSGRRSVWKRLGRGY